MTHLTITEDAGEEFVLRGHNTVTDADEDAIVFYKDVMEVLQPRSQPVINWPDASSGLFGLQSV